MKNKTLKKLSPIVLQLTLLPLTHAQSLSMQGPATSSQNLRSVQDHADQLSAALGCQSFTDIVWNETYRMQPDSKFYLPTQFAQSLEESLERRLSHLGQSPALSELKQNFISLDQLLNKKINLYLNTPDNAQTLAALSALELGDRTTARKRHVQALIQKRFATIISLSRSLNLECANPQLETKILTRTQAPRFRSANNNAVAGALKTMGTLYQSCQVLDLAPVKASTPDAQGISTVGTHPGGVGKKRIVSNAALLARTHYYLKNIDRVGSECIDVKGTPPIYDFGGKPYATSDIDSPLNYFRNAGSGTSALGTDCSGFVYSALATAGLKLKSAGALKAIGVMGVSAAMIKDPAENGLDCLAPAAFSNTRSILPGDLIASSGHIVMVDTIGEDPFGIAALTRVSDCTSSKISTRRFDFSILQSAPIKNGMGVNRIPIADYLTLSSSFQSALVSFAVKACKAKFGQTMSAPSSLAIVRHKGSPQCLSRPVSLSREACVATCNAR